MRREWWPYLRENPIPVFALVGLLAGAVLQWIVGQPEIAAWVWRVTLVGGGAPLAWGTVKGMLRGRFAADVVAMLAIVTAVITDEPFAGAIVVLMQSGGEALDSYGMRRAQSSLTSLLARAPRTARRKRENRLEEIDAADVQVGDLLVVSPGELVPVDGTLLTGEAEIDESALTGEPLAHPKLEGDGLLSGSVNAGGAFEMRADAPSSESQYARIVALVRQAQDSQSPVTRLADRYAVWFTPLTLLLCAFGWWYTGNPETVLSVLVVATPCPLILATPIAVISGINRAAKEGIIVKGGAALEQVGRAQAVVFDKTGTLTFGTPSVERVVALDGLSEEELLHRAASVEQLSSHLLARTLTIEAQNRLGHLPLPEDFRETPGHGVEGVVGGRHVRVGSHRFIKKSAQEKGHDLGEHHSEHGMLSAYIAIDHQPRGLIFFSDRLRPGVPQMMKRLRELGVRHTVMLTGDHRESAMPIAHAAGVDEVDADLLPADKVTAVRMLKEQYDPVVMVGDGINDAPALATATVGVAMGARGSAISSEAAGIVLLVDDIGRVADIIDTGKRTLRIARQSIYAGLGVSLALMVVAGLGYIPAPIGALSQEVLDVAVILNALRAR